jgi:type I restriction enzyme S subunit
MPLADAVHTDCKLSYGIVQPGDDVDGGLPIVRPVDLKTRIINSDTLKRTAPERAAGYARTQLVGGELLLCVRGSTGEVSVASDDLAGCNVTRGIAPIRFDPERVLPEFAFFQFRSHFVRAQIAAKTCGAALMQINIKDLRELAFVVPPMAEQRKAVARAERLFDGGAGFCDNYQAQLADLANLRQSLLQKAFSGNLMPD